MEQQTIALAGGTRIPLIGLGTWPLDDEEARRVVRFALDLGYRHVDTAENYGNERGVGDGLRDSGLDRGDVWVTTKFNRRWHTDVLGGLAGNLERLGLDYVDLALIHWPNPDQDRYVDAWRGLIDARERGLARAIGTSNFTPAHLDRLLAETGVAPEVNQIECHPYLPRVAERAHHARHGISTTAWSPLGRGGQDGLLAEPAVGRIAGRHGATPAQVVLAWCLQQGVAAIPKSASPARLRENLDALGVRLDDEELAALTALPAPAGFAPLDPDRFGH